MSEETTLSVELGMLFLREAFFLWPGENLAPALRRHCTTANCDPANFVAAADKVKLKGIAFSCFSEIKSPTALRHGMSWNTQR